MVASSFRIAFVLGLVGACGQPPGAATGDVTASAASPSVAGEAPKVTALEAADPPSLSPFTGGERAFLTVKDALLKTYSGSEVGEDDLYRAAVQGMLEHVDAKRRSWNKLLSPEELRALQADLHGEVVGIGAEIRFDEATGHVDVLNLLPGSSAEKAGVLAGDTILDVNGKLFKGKTQQDVLAEIRGKAGETVTLAVLRGDRVLTIPIVRAVVAYDVVRDQMLEGKTGYLRVKSFNDKTPAAVDHALDDLSAHGAESLVIDMRGNPGGGFDDAIASAQALLPSGATIVRIAKRGEPERAFLAKGATKLADVPMVVLVDGDTSSGGEFLTAALRLGRHARIVGSRTFGKWSMQTVEDLPNGYAVKYTISLLRTAEGKTYEGVGLEPDIEVDMNRSAVATAQGETDPTRRLAIDAQLRTAVALLQAK